MSANLPPELATAIAARLAAQGSGAAMREASAGLSEAYRASSASSRAIRSDADAIAYAISRMPATYAAVAHVLDELSSRAPDFAPRTLLDAGAGPGTATWAARETYPTLVTAELRDTNPAFLDLAQSLSSGLSPLDVTVTTADMAVLPHNPVAADLVVAAYALTELGDAALQSAAAALWQQTGAFLVIVEPGRPRDYARLLRVRAMLLEKGAAMIAPCPHANACPLVTPDWCHFAVRLPRSRAHQQAKGASLGYEDEKFSYLVLARPGTATPSPARIIKPPVENKHSVRLQLCTDAGLRDEEIASRDRDRFKAARKLRWGDVSEI